MSDTFSQIYIQIVFAVEGRDNVMDESWRGNVFKYISGIVSNKGQKSIIVNGMSDHVHLFVGLKPSIRLSDLVRDVKSCSSNYINDNRFVENHFAWQEGFGAFSYSKSHIEKVYNYIKNQEIHHKKRNFKEEYITLLKKFEIQYSEEHLFNWIDQ